MLYLSNGPLQAGVPEKWQPELDGNTYVQNDGGTFVIWPGEDANPISYLYYYDDSRDTVTDVIQNILGDESGTALKS